MAGSRGSAPGLLDGDDAERSGRAAGSHGGQKMRRFPLLALALLCAASSGDRLSSMGLAILDHGLGTTLVPLVQSPERSVTIEDVSAADETLCSENVSEALGHYPSVFVKALVRKVGLAGDISVWGRRVGSVQGPGFVAINCIQAPANQGREQAAVHDALAAKVTDLSPPDWQRWERNNPSGFEYGNLDAYKAELEDPDARVLVSHLNGDGFVSRYGLLTRVSDFESYAEQAFKDGAAFAVVAREHPRMQRKLRILIDTYLALAPSLRTYFDQTGLASAAGVGRSADATAAQSRPASFP